MNKPASSPLANCRKSACILVAALLLPLGGLAAHRQAGAAPPAPSSITQVAASAMHIAAGSGHTCAVTKAGGVKCWGWNNSYQIGDGTSVDRPGPVDVKGLQAGVVAVTAGEYHSCALTTAGTVKCWGANDKGQLGDGTTTTRSAPVSVAGLTDAVAVEAGSDFTCALTSAGGVKCWGANTYGQLGDGTLTDSKKPVAVVDLAGGALLLAAGGAHACVAMSEASGAGMRCWGENGSGALGDSTMYHRVTPVPVAGLSGVMRSISADGGHTCSTTIRITR